MFTLLPLLAGEHLAHQGQILAKAALLAEEGKLMPLLNECRFSEADLTEAYAAVEKGSLGKVVIDIE